MFYLLSALVGGISLAPLFMPQLDIWHSQGFFFQSMLMVAFSYSLFEKSRGIIVNNRSLLLLSVWLGGMTAYICFAAQAKGKYDVSHFFPYFNFLCLLIFYRLIVEYLDREKIEKILNIMRGVVILTMFVSILQYFGLSQFWKLIHEHYTYNNIVSGFLGNGTHLSGFLAMCSPLFFWKFERVDKLSLCLMATLMMFSGTNVNEPSLSGPMILCALLLIFLFIYHRKYCFIILGFIALSVILAFIFLDKSFLSSILSMNGRIGLWQEYWRIFKANTPVTGTGLGSVNIIYTMTTYPLARHLHLEYFQFLFETGIIGLVLIFNLIIDFLKRLSLTRLDFTLKLIVIGFLMSCLFNYPAHLWLPASWAMFAYASLFAIENERLICLQAASR